MRLGVLSGDREVILRLRALTALLEDPGTIPCTHMGLTVCNSSSWGSKAFGGLHGQWGCEWCTGRGAIKTFIHTKKNLKGKTFESKGNERKIEKERRMEFSESWRGTEAAGDEVLPPNLHLSLKSSVSTPVKEAGTLSQSAVTTCLLG